MYCMSSAGLSFFMGAIYSRNDFLAHKVGGIVEPIDSDKKNQKDQRELNV